MLSIHCRKNGWTDISGELQEYEKVLEEDKKAESRSFFAWQYVVMLIIIQNIIYKVTQNQSSKVLYNAAHTYIKTIDESKYRK